MNINELFETELTEINEPNSIILEETNHELAGGLCGVGCQENM